MLKDALIKSGFNSSIKLFADLMVWYDPTLAPRYTRYQSDDAFVIESQFDVAQAVGIDGWRITYQGLNASSSLIQTNALRQIAQKCQERSMELVLLLDPAIAKLAGTTPPDQGVVNQLLSPQVQEVINIPTYLKDSSGKPIIMEFNLAAAAGANIANIQKLLPQYNFGSNHVMYSWPDMPWTTAALASYQAVNANPAMLMPGIMIEFNDAGFVEPSGVIDNDSEVWTQGTPFREQKSLSGNFFFDQLATVQKNTQYLSLATWNDYRERTTWEQFFAAITGIRIGS